jgi:hypothetical protein
VIHRETSAVSRKWDACTIRSVAEPLKITFPPRAGSLLGGLKPVIGFAPRPRQAGTRPGLPAGWAAWLENRWVSVRDPWFRLRTLGAYRP